MLKISVVIPSFNQAAYLDQALDSLTSQAYQNLELIVIDGGSTDESVQIIQRYANQIHYWVSEPDRGQTHAINKGLEHCTGEVWSYLNSDDLLTPGSLAIVAQHFESNPEMQWLGGVSEVFDRKINLFSGEDFTVDESVGLNGTCDFLFSRSPKLIEIQAPVFILVEAKKSDLKMGLGQCAAEMVAAQRFNQQKNQSIPYIYGCISNGTQWRFLKLSEQTLTIDLYDYPFPLVETILSFLVWMAQN